MYLLCHGHEEESSSDKSDEEDTTHFDGYYSLMHFNYMYLLQYTCMLLVYPYNYMYKLSYDCARNELFVQSKYDSVYIVYIF